MPNFNQVTLLGTLTRDPEIKYLPSGKAVADIGMAINRSYTTESGEKREEVTFVDIAFFGRVAEVIGEYCKKGHPLFVQGYLKLDTWDDKTSGQKRSKLKIIGDTMQLLSRGDKPAGNTASGQAAQRPAKPPADPDLDAPDDSQEIPF